MADACFKKPQVVYLNSGLENVTDIGMQLYLDLPNEASSPKRNPK